VAISRVAEASRANGAVEQAANEERGDVRTIPELLTDAHTIAVVGMSADETKAAYRIPAMLIEAGYYVIPVNPSLKEIRGLNCVASLEEIEETVDIVDVFRPPRYCAAIATQAVQIGAGAVWLQLGIVSADARTIAEGAGLDYVEDRCIKVELQRFGIRAS
jgi:hypothetical protein